MTNEESAAGGDIARIRTDADRDEVVVQVRLDKVVLVVASHHGHRGQAELSPADARTLSRALLHAAQAAEETPASP